MLVGKVEPILNGRVLVYRSFLYSVSNDISRLVFIEVFELILPVARCISSRCLTSIYAICIEFKGNTVRSDSILVIRIIPSLLTRNSGFLNFMSVLDIIACHLRCVSIYSNFLDCILNLSVAIVVLENSSERIVPIACRISSRSLASVITVGIQLNGNRAWTLAILVICINPCLSS